MEYSFEFEDESIYPQKITILNNNRKKIYKQRIPIMKNIHIKYVLSVLCSKQKIHKNGMLFERIVLLLNKNNNNIDRYT